jgi:thiol-disulfide isomerase/thioredoxin
MKRKSRELFRLSAGGFAIMVIAVLLTSCATGGSEEIPESKIIEQPQTQPVSQVQGETKTTVPSATLAPSFSRPDLEGNTVNSADFSGKVVLVDFWATWCPPCRRSIPHLVDLHQKYSDQGFAVVGVSLDTKGPEEVAKFAQNFRIPYTIVMGDRQMAEEWKLGRGIPTAFLVDRKGNVVNTIVGYKELDYYENLIKLYL